MLAYVCSRYLPVIALPSILSDQYWYIGGAGGIGIFLSLAGSWEFRKAKTTIHPSKSEKVRYLVTGGNYGVTRNPMYLGMLLVIVAASFKCGSYYGFIALPFFMLYITQFQIKPEARIIEKIFGEEYLQYKKNVKRWL
jgi:protein-S-isoprenylcysteine O-methyltransferase Ste14